jgi:glycine betaine/proline transport system substrate-binding protein
MKLRNTARLAGAAIALSLIATACGDDSTSSSGSSKSGAAITLAVNPWTGSAVNANVAKVVLESKLGTPVTLKEVNENVSWTGLDTGDIDANLEIWPSGHAADFDKYITQKKTVVDIGKLGPTAKIGWFIPQFVLDAHPDLATWEGFKNPDNAKLFATADSGDQGRFMMGDPSYVTYDEQIIKNLELPLKYTVAGSEAALLTAIDQAEKDKTPLLMQFWKPHWKHAKVKLAEVKLPDVTPECLASAAAGDGAYKCDYAPDELYKAASAKLEAKNAKASAFLKKFQLSTDQQNEIAAMIDGDGMSPGDAAKKWVAANGDAVNGWLG